jgi:hypothetical protein
MRTAFAPLPQPLSQTERDSRRGIEPEQTGPERIGGGAGQGPAMTGVGSGGVRRAMGAPKGNRSAANYADAMAPHGGPAVDYDPKPDRNIEE